MQSILTEDLGDPTLFRIYKNVDIDGRSFFTGALILNTYPNSNNGRSEYRITIINDGIQYILHYYVTAGPTYQDTETEKWFNLGGNNYWILIERDIKNDLIEKGIVPGSNISISLIEMVGYKDQYLFGYNWVWDEISFRKYASLEPIILGVGSETPIILVNNPPIANNDVYSVEEDSVLSISAPGVLSNDADFDGDTLSSLVVSGPTHGILTLNSNGGFNYSPTPNYNGADSFTYKSNDGDSDSNIATASITVAPVNDAPVINVNQPTTIVDEGSLAYNSGTWSDIDGDIATLTASIGTVITGDSGEWTWSLATSDGPAQSQSVTITADDANEGVSTTTFFLIINNVAPTAKITDPSAGSVYAVGSVTFTGTYLDPGISDTHIAQWTFDSITTPQQSVSSGLVSTSYPFTTAGVYSVKLTVTDNDDDLGTATTVDGQDAYVVVYDPNAGFVTGGGWIISPAGAFTDNPSLTGRANFGFVSKYETGATIPTGETEFQFKIGGLNFHSTVYQWLVVAGAKAQYKGSGTINGTGDYGFLLTAIDGQLSGGGGVDKFRIKIVDKVTEMVVYDNALGSSDDINDANPKAIGGGSIVIHKQNL